MSEYKVKDEHTHTHTCGDGAHNTTGRIVCQRVHQLGHVVSSGPPGRLACGHTVGGGDGRGKVASGPPHPQE